MLSIWFQPYLVDPEAEMAELGLREDISGRAYLMARLDLLAAAIDVFELPDVARRYDRLLRGESDKIDGD